MELIREEQGRKVYLGDFFKGDIQTLLEENELFSKALLITGQKSFVESTHYKHLISLCEDKGIEIVEHIKIQPNPLEMTLLEITQSLTSKQIDLVIAVGGGSVIDVAKFIKHELTKDVTILAIYTLPGSATIVTPFSVYDNHEFKIGLANENLVPELSYVNSLAIDLLDLKRKSIAIADIFSHAVESLYSTAGTEESKKDAQIALDVLIQTKIENLSAQDLIRADIHAGLSERVGLVLFPHAAGHYLTYKFGVPHSVATMFFLNQYLELLIEREFFVEKKYLEYSSYLYSLLMGIGVFPEIVLTNEDIKNLLRLSKQYMGFAYENAPVEISDSEYESLLEKYAR